MFKHIYLGVLMYLGKFFGTGKFTNKNSTTQFTFTAVNKLQYTPNLIKNNISVQSVINLLSKHFVLLNISNLKNIKLIVFHYNNDS